MEHMYDGVGLLSLASEAAIRMGGVRITACDTGVYRSSMSLALEETSLLIRCHGLPVKSFRPVLNTLKEVSLMLVCESCYVPLSCDCHVTVGSITKFGEEEQLSSQDGIPCTAPKVSHFLDPIYVPVKLLCIFQ